MIAIDKDGNKLVAVEQGSITEKAIAVGQIQPRQKFQVKSKISGIVRKCMVNVGDRVKTGDALFEIAQRAARRLGLARLAARLPGRLGWAADLGPFGTTSSS